MTKKRDIEVYSIMGRYGFTPYEIGEITRAAVTLARLAETRCNRGLSDREEKRDDSCEAHILDVIAIRDCRELSPKKTEVEFNGDPRGCVVTIRFIDGRELGIA